MNYTKEQRKVMVRALRACKSRLWDGTENRYATPRVCHYICLALPRRHEGSTLARRLIKDRLLPYWSLDSWLYHQLGDARWSAEYTTERAQAHRLAWINLLIEELQQ